METLEKLGKYEIKRTLGKGAMGIVYEGWDPIIARRVAIKTVRLPDTADDPETEEALARFRREAQAAGRLTHPNIVGVFDYGETNDLAYIVMEFVDGPSVKSLVDKQERFAVADTLRIMTDLLNGLQFSHDRGVVHRDIKPANIMLTSDGQGKIADFGIARIESSSMTQAGTVLGTPAYMSPEQFMGQVVDARTDIYSSGVVLYQLLTGERPFEGGMSAIMHKALNTEPVAPSQLAVTCPQAFDGVVRKAMAKRPEDRFQSASAFLDAIRAAASGQAMPGMDDPADDEATMVAPARSAATSAARVAPAAPAPAAAAAAPPARRSAMPMIAVAVVIVVLLAGGGGWFFLRGSSSQAPAPPTAAVTPNQPAPAPAATASATPPAAPTPPAATQAAPASNPAPPPAQTQTAGIDLNLLRNQIAQLASAQQCATVDGDIGAGGSVTLTGIAGVTAANALRQGLAGITIPGATQWQVQSVDQAFCPALDVVHPIAPSFDAAAPRLGLTLVGGNTRLRDGEHILPQLAMPNFPAHLVVDYIAHDGGVLHLYPQVADPGQKITADPSRTFQPGESVRLGVVSAGHPAWEVGPPYGTDMIIAIASAQPLFAHPRPANGEDTNAYLQALQSAVQAAQAQGVQMTGSAITVDTLPKR